MIMVFLFIHVVFVFSKSFSFLFSFGYIRILPQGKGKVHYPLFCFFVKFWGIPQLLIEEGRYMFRLANLFLDQ